MSWFILAQFFSTLIELVLLRHQTDRAKDFQILLLRRQLAIVERKLDKPLKVSRAEKFDTRYIVSQTENHNRTDRQATERCDSNLPTGDRVQMASRVGAAQVDLSASSRMADVLELICV